MTAHLKFWLTME